MFTRLITSVPKIPASIAISVTSLFVSVGALVATSVNAWSAFHSLRFNRETAIQTQKATMFSQFQQQYTVVSSRFPAQHLDPNFRPARGSDDYARLQAYWFFCFSEWYATTKLNPDAFRSLWDTYYSRLIGGALDIRSLRYVLEDMIQNGKLIGRDWPLFFSEVALIAQRQGHPLSVEVERSLSADLRLSIKNPR